MTSYRERATDPQQYDRGGVIWEREGSSSHYIRRLYREALNVGRMDLDGRRALDVGCGSGWLVSDLASAGAIAVGIDASETNIETARTKYPGLEFILSSLTDYSPSVKYSYIFVVMVFEHIDDLESSFLHLHGLLEPGGTLTTMMADFDRFSQPRFGYSVRNEIISHDVVATRTDYGDRMGILYDMVRSPEVYLDSAQRCGFDLGQYWPVGAPGWLTEEQPRYLEYAGKPLFHRFDFDAV